MTTQSGFPAPVQSAVAPGGAVSTPLGPFPGLNVGDTLISARHVSSDLVTNAEITDVSITDADTVEVGATGPDTTGDFVIVTWKGES